MDIELKPESNKKSLADMNENVDSDNNVDIKLEENYLEDAEKAKTNSDYSNGDELNLKSEDDDQTEFTLESIDEDVQIEKNPTSKRKNTEPTWSSDEEEFAGFEENTLTDYKKVKKHKQSPSRKRDVIEPTIPNSQQPFTSTLTADARPSSPQTLKSLSPVANLPLEIKAENFDKSNTTPTIPVLKKGGARTVPLSDPIYRKPFEYGWKRELVLRAIPEASKEKGEVYYITPTGKKLRTRNEIFLNIPQDGSLTIENFTFSKEALGVGPDLEIIRSAKISTNAVKRYDMETNITPGKRVPKPKVPKGASPPPNINRSSLNKPNRSISTLSSAKKDISKEGKQNDEGGGGKSTKPPKCNPCTIQCVLAMGTIPQLQCKKCLCLYHPECVAVPNHVSNLQHYICEGCKADVLEQTTNENEIPINVSNSDNTNKPVNQQSTTSRSHTLQNAKKNVVDSLTTWHHHATNISTNCNMLNTIDTPPQTIASINGRKFIVVPKTNVLNVSPSRNGRNNINFQSVGRSDNGRYSHHTFSLGLGGVDLRNNNLHSMGTNVTQLSATLIEENSMSRKKSVTRTPKTNASEQETSNEITSPSNSSKCCNDLNSSVQRLYGENNEFKSQETFTKYYSTNFFSNLSMGYDILLQTFEYLKVQELLRAGCVCRLWNQAANHSMLWKTVRMKNSQVNDWKGLTTTLIKNGTKHLDLRKMLSPKNSSDELWKKFSKSIGNIHNLESIDLCKCSIKVVESLFESNGNLKILNAVSLKDETLNLKNVSNLTNLTELRLKSLTGLILDDLSPLKVLKNIKHLSLTSVKALGLKNIEILGELNIIESLELGECSEFSNVFVTSVLLRLTTLQRLRLEKGQESCCTFDILNGVAQMENLVQLELINFDIKAEFDHHISKCKNIKKLLLIPTYVSQSATTNQIVLSGIMKLSDSLTNFTWAVTGELVRVTELYVDNCDATKRNKKSLSDCIPVLKPVPGILDSTQIMSKRVVNVTEVPQVEILPLTSVEKILLTALPYTKVNMIIIAYHATWRQNLVDN